MAKRICNIHGIWEKSTTQTRCPECARERSKLYDTDKRDKDLKVFYNSSEWRNVRNMHLKAQPLCVVCGRPAAIVDHIIEIKDGGCRLCDDNLQSMCISCHNTKTAAEKKKREGRV